MPHRGSHHGQHSQRRGACALAFGTLCSFQGAGALGPSSSQRRCSGLGDPPSARSAIGLRSHGAGNSVPTPLTCRPRSKTLGGAGDGKHYSLRKPGSTRVQPGAPCSQLLYQRQHAFAAVRGPAYSLDPGRRFSGRTLWADLGAVLGLSKRRPPAVLGTCQCRTGLRWRQPAVMLRGVAQRPAQTRRAKRRLPTCSIRPHRSATASSASGSSSGSPSRRTAP